MGPFWFQLTFSSKSSKSSEKTTQQKLKPTKGKYTHESIMWSTITLLWSRSIFTLPLITITLYNKRKIWHPINLLSIHFKTPLSNVTTLEPFLFFCTSCSNIRIRMFLNMTILTVIWFNLSHHPSHGLISAQFA